MLRAAASANSGCRRGGRAAGPAGRRSRGGACSRLYASYCVAAAQDVVESRRRRCGYSRSITLLEAMPAVDGAADRSPRASACAGSGAPSVEPEPRAHETERVLGVAAVEDREAVGPAEAAPRSAAAPCSRRSGRCRRPRRSSPPPASSTSARRSISCAARRVNVRSRIARGSTPDLDQARDAVHERPRLAAARARHHQDRPVDRAHRLELRGIQLAAVVDAVALPPTPVLRLIV